MGAPQCVSHSAAAYAQAGMSSRPSTACLDGLGRAPLGYSLAGKETMMRATVLVLGVVVFLAGCAGEREPQPTPEQIAQQKVQQALSAGSSEGPSGPSVEVAADGSRFEPPVQIDQLPPGVWYCDMGTVHYARRDRGDGQCAIYKMELTRKAGPAIPPSH